MIFGSSPGSNQNLFQVLVIKHFLQFGLSKRKGTSKYLSRGGVVFAVVF